nr:S-layer homology domain-containing protein [uncultured Flavobacterium sp.]
MLLVAIILLPNIVLASGDTQSSCVNRLKGEYLRFSKSLDFNKDTEDTFTEFCLIYDSSMPLSEMDTIFRNGRSIYTETFVSRITRIKDMIQLNIIDLSNESLTDSAFKNIQEWKHIANNMYYENFEKDALNYGEDMGELYYDIEDFMKNEVKIMKQYYLEVDNLYKEAKRNYDAGVYKSIVPEVSETITVPISTPSPVVIFNDVNSNNTFFNAIKFVKDSGFVSGYQDGTFKSDNTINRAELLKILLEAKYDVIEAEGGCFKDVPANEWYSKYVCLGKKENIIGGYKDGTFKPTATVNVAEALKIVLETFYDSIPDANGEWYEKYKQYAEYNGLYLGDFWKSVNDPLTRGQMAELVYRIKK